MPSKDVGKKQKDVDYIFISVPPDSSELLNPTITIWPAEPEAPERPLETLPSITWQELQAQQNERILTIIRNRRIEKIGRYYERIIGEIDWDLEGVTRCRVKGAPCYGRDFEKMEVVNDTPFHCKARGLYFSVAYYEINLTITQEKSYTNPVPSPPSLCRTQSGRIKKKKNVCDYQWWFGKSILYTRDCVVRCQMPDAPNGLRRHHCLWSVRFWVA